MGRTPCLNRGVAYPQVAALSNGRRRPIFLPSPILKCGENFDSDSLPHKIHYAIRDTQRWARNE